MIRCHNLPLGKNDIMFEGPGATSIVERKQMRKIVDNIRIVDDIDDYTEYITDLMKE